MEDRSFDSEYRLDLETGEIQFVSAHQNAVGIDLENQIGGKMKDPHRCIEYNLI